MKKYFLILLIIPFLTNYSQKIGQLNDEKPNIEFPVNAVGMDLMIGEGGFGFGGFYRYNLTTVLTVFTDFSVSESKDEREIERYDIFGYPLPIYGKKNRLYLLPLNFGLQYRLFPKSLTDNLRPYVSIAFGPTMFITSPAEKEFFKSLAYAHAKYGIGGYVGFGANFGTNVNNLTGINIRYYINQLFGEGIEQYYDKFKKNVQQVSLTINIGIMY
ncbi:MAG: hypothetical protein HYS24_08705 [Ignavibacteriales bacterium]|nr:hypothetical protein [Ignavibacteriales bacterium]